MLRLARWKEQREENKTPNERESRGFEKGKKTTNLFGFVIQELEHRVQFVRVNFTIPATHDGERLETQCG